MVRAVFVPTVWVHDVTIIASIPTGKNLTDRFVFMLTYSYPSSPRSSFMRS